MAYSPKPAGPGSLRELFHYLYRELTEIGVAIGNGGGGSSDHDDLTNVTPNQHHPQLHDLTSHTDVNAPNPADTEVLTFEAGQWIPLPASGSGTTESNINQVAHGFADLDAIRHNGVSWVKALADDVNTTALGIVVAVGDVDNFTFAMSGRYPLSGLSVDEWYYLSDTVAGELVTVEPEISQPIIYSEEGSSVVIYPYRPSTGEEDGVEEAPIDGTPYSRQDAGWVAAGTGSGSDRNVDGGSANSVYLPNQVIDGGDANG